MCVEKQCPLGCQAIDVWSLCQRMPTKRADPIILVVDRDEHDIRPIGWVGSTLNRNTERKQQKGGKYNRVWPSCERANHG